MIISSALGALAGVAALLAYALYLWQTVKKRSTPNPSTWLIWLLAGIMNVFTYFSVVGGNIWQSLFVIAVTFSVLVIFVYALFRGRFAEPQALEIVSLGVALGIGVFWQTSHNDRLSNLLLQGIYVVSYVPTVTGLLRGTSREHYSPWLMAVISYALATSAIAIEYPGDWIAFVNPVLNGLMGNGLVLLLVLRIRSVSDR